MAYNRRYNPDALPAHAEPEQAAQMLSSQQPARTTSQRSDSYGNSKPTAPSTQSSSYRSDDRYNSSNSAPKPQRMSSSTSYEDQRRQGSGSGGRSSSGYNDDGYGSNAQAARHNSYSSGGGGRTAQAAGRPPAPPSKHGGGGDRDRDALWPMFRAVDKNRTLQLSEQELGAALVNGDYTSFDPHTVKMMIRMFDVDRSGTIDFDEFCGLWGFLSEWRKLFDRFDVDRSGNISFGEFSDALVAFGYRLSPEYVRLLFATYDTRGRGGLSFDLFVQACISLKRMTDVFKKYDQDRDGYITLSFEQFLTGSQSLFLFNSISPATDLGLY